MHISRLELENIKSYTKAAFQFERGTTAITGRNGAGKTTIIEAIAWALFDQLDYTKDEFVRRGAKKGSVDVSFVSGLDEREYRVHRDSGSGYYVFDPRLDTRVADKKEEVFRFLWQHLGLEPGTDLRSLFRQAIGVPQGTFTAIFLEAAGERKAAFDRLLKVEEYRQAAEKLKETVKYLGNSIGGVRESIARAEGILSRSDDVDREHDELTELSSSLAKELSTIENERKTQRRIVETLDKLAEIERTLERIGADRLRAAASIDDLAKARSEIARLAPLSLRQNELEKTILSIRDEVAAARAATTQLKGLDDRVDRLREKYRTNNEKLKEAEERGRQAEMAADLESREAEITMAIASRRAELERDERFQREIKDGLCPILSQRCLNLKDGETLESFVSNQFADLRNVIANLEKERSSVSTKLKAARDAAKFAAAAVEFRKREEELRVEGTQLTKEREPIEKNAAKLAGLERVLEKQNSELYGLGDPRSLTISLQRDIDREPEIRETLARIERANEELRSERDQIFEQLESIDGSEIQINSYDKEFHAAETAALRDLDRRHAETGATLKNNEQQRQKLALEIKQFKELRYSLASEFKEKERLEKVVEATEFIRSTLKDAAPQVARNYVYHVSSEANLLFREITGNGERTLRWSDDYAIIVEEGGFDRPFQSLSGGEQMAAALAVRLALLKQLTDIRIAFFDEPTTNMDAERRENLAVEISRVSNFDQLFIISHDETFDNFVDNVVAVG